MDSVQFLVLVSLAWFLVDGLGLTGAGLAWLGSILAQQLVAYIYARRLVGQPFQGVGRVFMAIVVSAAVAVVIALGVINTIGGVTGILIAVVCAIGSTLFVMAGLDHRLGLGLKQIIAEPFPWAFRFSRLRRVDD
jgi:hypothetical protein